MNEGRRRQLGKLAFDVAKYFSTLVGGAFLLKPEALGSGILPKAFALVLVLLVVGWLIYPKGKE